MRKERPMIFSTPMVEALLANLKTKTRRLNGLDAVNESPGDWQYLGSQLKLYHIFQRSNGRQELVKNPFGVPGDLLWVRENGWVHNNYQPGLNDADLVVGGNLYFQAGNPALKRKDWIKEHYCFFPSIFMYKAFARAWLEITDIKAERLQDITEEDAIAEGIDRLFDSDDGEVLYYFYTCNDVRDDSYLPYAKVSFTSLWASINGWDSWAANPWVWVISFRVLSTTGRPISLERKEVLQ